MFVVAALLRRVMLLNADFLNFFSPLLVSPLEFPPSFLHNFLRKAEKKRREDKEEMIITEVDDDDDAGEEEGVCR